MRRYEREVSLPRRPSYTSVDRRPPALLVHEDEIPLQIAQAVAVSIVTFFHYRPACLAEHSRRLVRWKRSARYLRNVASARSRAGVAMFNPGTHGRVQKAEAIIDSARSEVWQREEQVSQAKAAADKRKNGTTAIK